MTTAVLNNFVRGKLDTDLNGRFDLPVYTAGFPFIKNFICNYKGNLKYRTGFEYVGQTKGNQVARLFEFRFNTDQAYLVEATQNYMRFYTYDANGKFGYVTDGSGKILELKTDIPYSSARNMQKTQNADVMYIAERGINPKKLKRLSATSFSIENVVADGIDFGEVGFPNSTTFYKGRLWYGGFAKKPTTIKASKVVNYDNFTIPTSNKKDDDPLSLTLSDISDPISWVVGGKRNLVVGNPEGITIVNGGTVDDPITSTAVNADLANREGTSKCYPTEKDSQMIYISTDKTKGFSFDYDLISESFVSNNLNLLSEDIGSVAEITYKRDKNNLVYGRLESGQMIALLYNKAENIDGWFPIETRGSVKSICSVTRPDGKDDLFICVQRNGRFYIERLADEIDFTDFYETDYANDPKKEKFNRLQLEELKKCIYLDNGEIFSNLIHDKLTFAKDPNEPYWTVSRESGTFSPNDIGHLIVYKTRDGSQFGTAKIIQLEHQNKGAVVEIQSKAMTPLVYSDWYLSFNKITGLEDLEGENIGVVADGGYIGEFPVKNGTISLKQEYTSCVIGYRYVGLAKTFNIGSYTGGRNGQTMKKRISDFILRFVNSAGFKVGTELDNLQNVQQFNPNGFYDNTPLLMNSDERIHGYNDCHDRKKNIYLVQDEPLPANVTMVEFEISFEAMK